MNMNVGLKYSLLSILLMLSSSYVSGITFVNSTGSLLETLSVSQGDLTGSMFSLELSRHHGNRRLTKMVDLNLPGFIDPVLVNFTLKTENQVTGVKGLYDFIFRGVEAWRNSTIYLETSGGWLQLKVTTPGHETKIYPANR